MAIGAYEPHKIMDSVHTTPEEAIEINSDIGAKRAIGMHWGTVMLSQENPIEAPARFKKAAMEQGFGQEKSL